MSQNHLEMPFSSPAAHPLASEIIAISDINLAFLRAPLRPDRRIA